MHKIYLTAILFLSCITAMGGNTDILENPDRFKPIHSCKHVLKPVSPKNNTAELSQSENAPASLIGKSYVVFYYERDKKCNSDLSVKAAPNDSIILEGFLLGIYDVKAKYDAESGIITIPTGMVIGKDATYGDVTLYALVNPDTFGITTEPIVGKVEGNKISFNYGVVGAVPYGGTTMGIYFMSKNVNAEEANGIMTYTVKYTAYSKDYRVPLIVTKTSEDGISIVGISTIVGGLCIPVPVEFDKTSNKASISIYSPVNCHTSGYYGYLRNIDQNNNTVSDLSFTIDSSDNKSTLNATTDADFIYFYKFDTDNKPVYGLYIMKNLKITVDFNIYAAEVDPENTVLNNIIYKLDNETKTAQVKGCDEGIGVISIPSRITVQDADYDVISIESEAFNGNRALMTVSLPASLKNIGTDAFCNVSNLRNLYIEDLSAWCKVEFANGAANPIYNVFPQDEGNWGKVYFNKIAFEGELTIPDGVTSIGGAFYGLKPLTKIVFPDSGLTVIGDRAFGNATKLKEVSIPSSVRSLGSAFFGCENLENMYLPEGLEAMGDNMFYRCTALNEITIPTTVKSIGNRTFMSCRNIKTLKSLSSIPPSCSVIGAMTPFDDFSNNATLMVPEEAVNAYKVADGWKVFKKIEPLAGAGIDSVESEEYCTVEYYNLQGQTVSKEHLEKGIYIVRKGSKISKVYLK